MIINFNPIVVIYRITSPTILCMIQSAYKYSTVLWINSTRPPAMSHYRFLLPWSNNIARHNGLYYVQVPISGVRAPQCDTHVLSLTAELLHAFSQRNDNSKEVENYFACYAFLSGISIFSYPFSSISKGVCGLVTKCNFASHPKNDDDKVIFSNEFLHDFPSPNKLKLNWEGKKLKTES